MTGIELVSGYLMAWATRTRNAGNRIGEGVDQALSIRLEMLQQLIVAKLGSDPALRQLEREAAKGGPVTVRTQRRLNDSIEEARETDPEFAAALANILGELGSTKGQSWSVSEIDLRGVKGAQIGDGNTQYNNF